MPNKKAVVTLSGGMDSAVCAAIVKDMGYELSALHLNYGQRTETRELQCFDSLCGHFGIKEKLIVSVDHFLKIGGSSLTDESIRLRDADLESKEIPNSYVPFRNANILAVAVSRAEAVGAEAVIAGAMQADSSGYPDCRREFFDAFELAANLGTKPETNIKILTPIIDFDKKDVVTTGLKLGVPFEKTWSCYASEGKACGKCDSCALRLRGFKLAGVGDPIEYR